MSNWQTIDTAPQDGTVFRYKREVDGAVGFQGRACWRKVHFAALPPHPLTGEIYSEAYDAVGWMTPPDEGDYRVPEPTHWQPL